jgi:hypothetical protein
MYASVPSLSVVGPTSNSVLSAFPTEASHAVVTSLVRSVASQCGLSQPHIMHMQTNAAESASKDKADNIKTEAQIAWFMEVSRCLC